MLHKNILILPQMTRDIFTDIARGSSHISFMALKEEKP
ncbi:MAG: hypothetical protein ACI92Z_002786 [Paracoccaceae bacterium]|jgi:hypothetical protein